jgi:hypothetical protein
MFLPAKARSAILCFEQFLAAIIVKGAFTLINLQNNMAAMAAVSTIRPTFFNIAFPPETCASPTAITGLDSDNCFIYKLHAS